MSNDSQTRVHVSNLSWSVDDATLKEKFSAVGTVTEAHIVTIQRTGRSKGFGFVTFANESEAQAAVDTLHDTDHDGRQIRVGISTSTGVKTKTDFPEDGEDQPKRRQRKKKSANAEDGHDNQNEGDNSGADQKRKRNRKKKTRKAAPKPVECEPGCRVHVSNISWDTNDEALKENFEAYGTVVEARVVRSHSGRSRGFGFVTFENAENASEAVDKLDGVPIDDRDIKVEISTTSVGPQKSGDGRRVYVSGLAETVGDDELAKAFDSFGEQAQARVVLNKKTGESFGYGFVTFVEKDDALKAVEQMNGQELSGQQLTVEIAKGRRRLSESGRNGDRSEEATVSSA